MKRKRGRSPFRKRGRSPFLRLFASGRPGDEEEVSVPFYEKVSVPFFAFIFFAAPALACDPALEAAVAAHPGDSDSRDALARSCARAGRAP